MQTMDEVLAKLSRAEGDLRNMALNWEAIGSPDKLRAATRRLTVVVAMTAAKAKATQLDGEALRVLLEVEARALHLEKMEREMERQQKQEGA